MNAETIFNDLGTNAVKASEIMDILGITIDDIGIPQTFTKLQSVIKYLSQYPDDTQRFLINKATRGKPIDKLSHMFEYTLILKDKEQYDKLLEQKNKELSVIGNDSIKSEKLFNEKNTIIEKIKELGDELETFNK